MYLDPSDSRFDASGALQRAIDRAQETAHHGIVFIPEHVSRFLGGAESVKTDNRAWPSAPFNVEEQLTLGLDIGRMAGSKGFNSAIVSASHTANLLHW